MKNNSIKKIVISALGMALVFLATYLIKIPNGIQGYFNLGDGFIMLFASITNPWMAFLLGGVGSALADVAGGYAMYFLPTLFIKGLEGLLIAFIFRHAKTNIKYIAYGIGAIVMVSGYALCDSLINNSWILGFSGVPANILQGVIGIVIAMLTLPILKRNIKDI